MYHALYEYSDSPALIKKEFNKKNKSKYFIMAIQLMVPLLIVVQIVMGLPQLCEELHTKAIWACY